MATTLDRGVERDEPVELQAVGTRGREPAVAAARGRGSGRGAPVGVGGGARGRRGGCVPRLLSRGLAVISVFFIRRLVVVVSAPLRSRSEVFTNKIGRAH